MIGPAMDRGGLKDSENDSNSFILKINRTVFWDLGADMYSWPQDRNDLVTSLYLQVLEWRL